MLVEDFYLSERGEKGGEEEKKAIPPKLYLEKMPPTKLSKRRTVGIVH